MCILVSVLSIIKIVGSSYLHSATGFLFRKFAKWKNVHVNKIFFSPFLEIYI